jgi:hypothetical protein
MTTGQIELMEHGRRRHIRRGRWTLFQDYGQDGAAGTATESGGAAGPSRDYGLDGAAAGLSRSTQRHADDTTTRPSWSGPTRQSDARDTESSYYLPKV